MIQKAGIVWAWPPYCNKKGEEKNSFLFAFRQLRFSNLLCLLRGFFGRGFFGRFFLVRHCRLLSLEN